MISGKRHIFFTTTFIIITSIFTTPLLTQVARTRNVAVVPVSNAMEYTKETIFSQFFPNFQKNYQLLQEKCKKAQDIPRIDMPVINTDDINRFKTDLEKGNIDIRPPYSSEHQKDPQTGKFIYFPKDLKADERGKEWLELGKKDGSLDDDTVFGKIEYVAVKDLIPVQSQIWLEVIIDSIIRWGVPKEGSKGLEMTIIISKEGYILDGHHRFATALLVDPNLKIKTLRVDLDITTLLKMGRSYGNAIGNEQNQ